MSLVRNCMQALFQKHTYSNNSAITSVVAKHRGLITCAYDVHAFFFCSGMATRSKMTGAFYFASSLDKSVIWYVAALVKKPFHLQDYFVYLFLAEKAEWEFHNCN